MDECISGCIGPILIQSFSGKGKEYGDNVIIILHVPKVSICSNLLKKYLFCILLGTGHITIPKYS